jgi:hypothetical protein
MSRTVDMTIVPIIGLVLDVGRVDGNSTGLFFRGLVDFSVVREFGTTLASKDLGDCSGQGGFAVIDVPYNLVSPKPSRNVLFNIPMVPMFMWGFVRVNLAASAYPLVWTVCPA